MKILVMKFRNIGDVLLTTPLLENLRHYFPDAIIDFALNKGTEAMIEGNPNVRKIHIYDRALARSGGLWWRIMTEFKFIRMIKNEKYDIAIQTTTGDRGIIIAKYAKIKTIVGFDSKNKAVSKFITHKVPKIGGTRHTVELNLDTLRALGLKPASKKVSVYFDEKCLDGVNLPEKFVHFHMTSRWMFKCTSDEVMAELIDFCEDKLGVKAVITADKNEEEMRKVSAVLALCKSKPLNLAGRLSLKQTVALSKRSLMFVGVDTAIMHIAAANDVPVVALFGPSNAQEWGAWDNALNESGYTRKSGNQNMGRHTVFQKDWECVSCEKAGCNDTRISRCLIEFSKDEIDKIKQKIREKIQ
ncbi:MULTISPECIES: putative lipopolysaccharide heptosyltransferase III [Campylobacter]|uniref:putative lipopolysaccharide heptosyltransferase III n=1 Tax=Campylobacter TaxID=194 RepID=UPI00027A3701|nr:MULTISPECIES: putative lipopolysaccharide heptosyltransferase III [Campylobacter]EJP74653.1 putative lipopolysaccharide heptosyltransferase III [Campylobacter sp. FOBRC14]